MFSDLFYRLRALLRRGTVEAELNEELRYHLERQVEKYTASGLSPEEAARRVRMDFGGADQIREECRDARGTRWLDDTGQDLRYAFRTLAKNPVFAATAVATLGLGIGASTALFSVTDTVLLRSLPYRDPDRLVLACRDLPRREVRDYPMSSLDFLDVRNGSKAIFEDLAAVSVTTRIIILPQEDGAPEQVRVQSVSPNLPAMLGAAMTLGRGFEAPDGAADAVILSYEYWQRRYRADPSVIGRTIPGMDAVVAGVLPPGFELLLPPRLNVERAPEIWQAMRLTYDNGQRNSRSLQVIGRLKNGVSLEQARAGANAVSAELESEFPVKKASGFTIRLEPMHRYLVEEVRPAVLALMGAVVFLLLIACANVANLLIVRTSLRGRELAVRALLGGSLSRLVRQMMTEAVVISALATFTGVAMAWLGIHELVALAPANPGLANLPRLHSIGIDLRTLVFALGAGLAAALIYGVAPAFRASRPDMMNALRSRIGPANGLPGGAAFRSGVVTVEVALSFVLLVASGLMFRSFVALQRIDPGFDPRGVLTFRLSGGQGAGLVSDLRRRLSGLPGVDAVTATNALPLAGGFPVIRWGREEEPPASIAGAADLQNVLPGYFETLRTNLVEGRTFTEADNAAGIRSIIIDRLLAAKAFPGEHATGKRILLGVAPQPVPFEIIGVVAHQRDTSLTEEGREQLYFTNGFAGGQVPSQWVIRASGDPAELAASVRAAVAQADPRLLITGMQPMETLIQRAQSQTRFSLWLFGLFAAVSALLAGVGLYGVLSTLVRQRTSEIGIRMALGAAPASVFGLVAGQGLMLSAAGVALGLAAAFGLTRVMSSMLVGVEPNDPPTFVVMTVVFFVITALASWLPARRAAGVDPAVALREE